jgi:O-antigen/teichoic acid export membrane protein
MIKTWFNSLPIDGQFKHFLNYIFSSVGIKALALISLPIVTQMLSPEEYGILNIFGFYVIIGSSLFTFNLHSSIVRYYQFKKYFFDTFFFQIVFIQISCALVITFLSLLYKNIISDFFNLPLSLILFFGPIISLNIINNWFIYYLKAKRDSGLYKNIFIIKQIISFITTILFIYLLDDKRYMGKVYSDVFVLVIFIFLFFRLILPIIRIRFDLNQLKFMFSYGIGLMPALISGAIISQLDRVMVAKYISMGDAGIYSLSYSVASILTLLSGAIYNSWIPDYFKLIGEKKYLEHDKKVISFVSYLTFICILIMLFGDIGAKILFADSFTTKTILIPIITFGVFWSALTPSYQRHISYSNKTYWTSAIFIICALLNYFLNMLLLPIYGVEAAAFTTLISYLCQFILSYLIVKLIIKMHTTSIVKILSITLPASLCFAITYLYLDIISATSIILRILLLFIMFYYFLKGKYFHSFN